jgi:hypothetical protein
LGLKELSGLRIVVSGLVATFPFGGVFWDYLQYVLGFARLGHEVLYLEDTGKWCYDPAAQTFVESGAANAAYLAYELSKLDSQLADRWFYRDVTGRTWGRSWQQVVEFCDSADLFVHISGSCLMRDEYFNASRVVLIDSDPMYTQALVPEYVAGRLTDPDGIFSVEMLLRHDAFFTFAENIADPHCRVPRQLFNWRPTRQPIVLDYFDRAEFQAPLASRRQALTTVMSWEPSDKSPLIEGVRYSGKGVEFLRFIDLPRAVSLPIEIAMSGPAPRDRLNEAGWVLIDGYQVSRDPWTYRSYLANSLGEWSVAKNAYVQSRSGWFSCRSACYLALGVPVVVQDTGFTAMLPSQEGILSFSTPEEAKVAIGALRAEPQRHARAAREIAHEYFDSKIVLRQLIDRAMAS